MAKKPPTEKSKQKGASPVNEALIARNRKRQADVFGHLKGRSFGGYTIHISTDGIVPQ